MQYTLDYTKITLCPSLNYECFCQVCGNCEYCEFYHTKEGQDCQGCGANFKNQPNLKAKFDLNAKKW